MKAHVRAVAAVIAVSFFPAQAMAQGGESSAIAEGLFQQARELQKQGRYDEACPKLAESQRLDPKLGTLLNLAVCHERQGRTATAWAEYTSAAAIARRDSQREREEFAHKQAAALDKKLARLILQVSTVDPGLVVTLDGQQMSAAVYGVPLPVDPGRHNIAATASGKTPWTKEIDVPAQPGEILVPIPALAAALVEPPPPPVNPPPIVAPPPPPVVVTPPPLPPARQEPSNTPAVLMGVGFGVGGVALLVGAIAGGVSLANTSSIKASCTGTTDRCPGQQGAINSANTLANVSNAGFIIGAVGLAVGFTGFALRPKVKDSAGVRLIPTLAGSPDSGAVGARVEF